jgi:copper chaperone
MTTPIAPRDVTFGALERVPAGASNSFTSSIPRPGIISNHAGEDTMETISYTVPGMHCGHCKPAVVEELSTVEGVEAVDVDLDTKVVLVRGQGFDDAALRAAIEGAGYEAA